MRRFRLRSGRVSPPPYVGPERRRTPRYYVQLPIESSHGISFRAVDAVLLALHGDECPPAAGALARSDVRSLSPTSVSTSIALMTYLSDGPRVSTRGLRGPWRPLAPESNTCLLGTLCSHGCLRRSAVRPRWM